MRQDLLTSMEHQFFDLHPMGLAGEEFDDIRKKHNTGRLHEFTKEAFTKDKFGFTEPIIADMIRLVQRATMVSLFEKPKFRDYVNALPSDKKDYLVFGFYELLYGDQEKGFNQILDILIEGKMARWSLISAFLYYTNPEEEVFCKPTTVKNILRTLEIEHMVYKPRPSYDFYVKFRKLIMDIKKNGDPRLGKDNAAVTGFLMLMMPSDKPSSL